MRARRAAFWAARSARSSGSAPNTRRRHRRRTKRRSRPLNSATFEQLRHVGFSVTQATRVLTYRERQGFESLDDLADLAGMPDDFLREVEGKLTL